MTPLFAKPHPDGRRAIEVWPLTFGRARIVLTDGHTNDDLW